MGPQRQLCVCPKMREDANYFCLYDFYFFCLLNLHVMCSKR